MVYKGARRATNYVRTSLVVEGGVSEMKDTKSKKRRHMYAR